MWLLLRIGRSGQRNQRSEKKAEERIQISGIELCAATFQ